MCLTLVCIPAALSSLLTYCPRYLSTYVDIQPPASKCDAGSGVKWHVEDVADDVGEKEGLLHHHVGEMGLAVARHMVGPTSVAEEAT